MTEETIKRSSFEELLKIYDRLFKDEEFGDMFEDYDIVLPYSDMRMPLSPSEPWCQDSIVEAKNNMK